MAHLSHAIFGFPGEFAIEIHRSDRETGSSGKPVDYGSPCLWLAGSRVGQPEETCCLRGFAQFLEAVLSVGQRGWGESLLGAAPSTVLSQIYLNVYGDEDELAPGLLSHHLLAPNGCETFDGCAAACVDDGTSSHFFALRHAASLSALETGILRPDDVSSCVIGSNEKLRIIQQAIGWLNLCDSGP